MKTVNVEELEGAALDWAVAKAIGRGCGIKLGRPVDWLSNAPLQFSTEWSQGGPLLDSYDIDINSASSEGIISTIYFPKVLRAVGDTRLVASCRVIVSAFTGSEVDVPEELLPCDRS